MASASGSFAVSAAAFIRNLIEVGVCSHDTCVNFYRPHPSPPSTPTKSLPPHIMEAAMRADVFPVGLIGRQLCAATAQSAAPFEAYVSSLFENTAAGVGIAPSTLLHALSLLERTQLCNMRAHHRGAVALHQVAPPPASESAAESVGPHSSCSSRSAAGRTAEAEADVCAACAAQEVFGLRYGNARLFLAAALLLSVKINEAHMAEADEDELSVRFAEMAACEVTALRCAERCICEILWDNLQVTAKAQESIMRRMSMIVIEPYQVV